jgi:DNA repair exonuclease SbcCD nuclease subunit
LRPQGQLDVLVLAGDIWNILEQQCIVAAIKIFKSYAHHIVYVSGNHELFGTNSGLDRGVQHQALQALGIHVLSRFTTPEVTIDGQHFCGTSMWYPRTERNRIAVETWADNRCIDSFKKFWPGEYEIEIRILNQIVTDRSIVVTHFLPCADVIHPRWAGHQDNHFFVAPARDIIQWHQPRYWIFGHTHDAVEMRLFETELRCNPLDYPNVNREREIKIFEVEL